MGWKDPRLFKIGKTKGWWGKGKWHDTKSKTILVGGGGTRAAIGCRLSMHISDTSNATISAAFFAPPGPVIRMLPYPSEDCIVDRTRCVACVRTYRGGWGGRRAELVARYDYPLLRMTVGRWRQRSHACRCTSVHGRRKPGSFRLSQLGRSNSHAVYGGSKSHQNV